jgi:FMN reductase [NAD(P)H]
MDVTEAIGKRKSVRAYEDKPVSKEVLSRIVDAGQWPPNAGPFHLSVVTNGALRKRINDRTKEAMVRSDVEFLRQRASLPGYEPLYGAPVLILLSAPGDPPYGPVNTALAAENMLLQATGLGLGSCFIITPTLALNASKELAKESGVPEGYAVQCVVLVGYAAAENKFSAADRAKKGAVGYVD